MIPADGRTLLVTGVTGFLGTRLAELATARNWTVRGLAREEWDGAPAVPLANRFMGSLPEAVPAAAFEGVHAVVHCAATATSIERTARAVNVAGTERVAALAVQAGVAAFVHISSSSAAPDALSTYGRSKFDGEVAVRNASRNRHPATMHTVILRPNLIVGPGGKGVYGSMVSMVERLPILPMLAGGRSIVQPIHVDDLCEAILRCLERAPELDGALLNLGHPVGIRLRDLLQLIARHRLGRKKLAVSVPIWPIYAVVAAAEALGLKLPVGKANLQGLKRAKRIETARDLEKLGLVLRPLEALGERADRGVSLPAVHPVSLILIGAGRMGLLHAATLSRMKGVRLAGLVDPVRGAAGLLHGLGIRAPHFRSLTDAIAKLAPEAAVVATPPPTHLAIAGACSTAGMSVLVEKPLGPSPDELPAWEKLERDHAGGGLRAGYVLPATPHVRHWLARLKAGELGEVRGFTAISLMSYMLAKGMKAWQANPAVSGGGVLMNPGVHVLSMIHAAFGIPREVSAESVRLYSARVEDSLAATLRYGGFEGRLYASWSIEGYARPEHVLTVRTSRGVLQLTGGTGVFSPADGSASQIAHQLDFPAEYDMAPDFAGAGFAAELAEVRDCAMRRRAQGRPVPGLSRAIDLERLVFRIYDSTASVDRFTPLESRGASRQLALVAPAEVPRYLDLRDLPGTRAVGAVHRGGPWDGFEITATQAGPWLRQTGERVHVTVPDFLAQSRLLLSGRAGTLVRQLGFRGCLAAGLGAVPAAVRDRGASFWAAADGLLAAGLSRLPSRFRGTILLHASLSDLAITLRRHDRLDRWLAMCRASQPVARVGFHTHLGDEAAQTVAVLAHAPRAVGLLVSPSSTKRDWCAAIRRAAGGPVEITAEVGPAPVAVHERAALDPGSWAGAGGGRADAVLVHAVADADLAEAWREDAGVRWGAAFPGMPFPAEAW